MKVILVLCKQCAWYVSHSAYTNDEAIRFCKDCLPKVNQILRIMLNSNASCTAKVEKG